jgi:hypothetical protein
LRFFEPAPIKCHLEEIWAYSWNALHFQSTRLSLRIWIGPVPRA